jgi:hypothetical protein
MGTKRGETLRKLIVGALVTGFGLMLAGGTHSATTAKPSQLYAWSYHYPRSVVGISAIRIGGPVLKRLRPGSYIVDVKADGDMPFHIFGPGLNRRTANTGASYVVYTRWLLHLKKGRYRYVAEGPGARLSQQGGLAIRGFFVVT